MADGLKAIFIWVFAGMVIVLSLFVQPLAETGFGLDKAAIPNQRPDQPGEKISLSGFVINQMVDSPVCKSLHQYGEEAIQYLKQQLLKAGADPNDLTGDKFTVVAGDYSYALVMGLALTIAGIAIILAGNEGEAEEKTILPLKK